MKKENNAPETPTLSDLSVELYRKLYLIRRAEDLIIKHYPEDEMKTPMHMSKGQEAISVGVCHALGPKNQILATYRSHAAFLAKTEDTDRFFAELYGRQTGTAQGKSGSMHLAFPEKGHLFSSAVVASGLPAALGVAFANQWKGEGAICSVFFGDGAFDEGVFWESLNVACVMKLPVLFVCEDNGYAVHATKEIRQGYKSIIDILTQFECNVFEENTADVELIYHLTQKGMDSIRQTKRPAFLHLKCCRYLQHIGIEEDFHLGYRSRDEYQEWFKRDSLAVQRKRLLGNGYLEEDLVRMETAIDEQLEGSLKKAKEAPFPTPDQLYRGVFYEKD